MIKKEILRETKFNELKLFKRGKVRDIYDLGDKLLIVSTDRISCFDVVLPTCIPYKGIVLNKLSIFWFKFTKDIIPNHLITGDVDEFPEELGKYKEILYGRSMLVKKTEPIPIECVVRGYLSGSAWKEYKQSQSVCGVKLPNGLKESDKLPEPIYTPATKEDTGHDINVTQQYVEDKIGKELATKIKDISLSLYNRCAAYAESRGIILADTKFEFGENNGDIILIDEIFTPDSSRFWFKDKYSPGKPQESLDKQFVRDYLESINWDKTPPAPELSDDIVEQTSMKYLQIYKILTGKNLNENP